MGETLFMPILMLFTLDLYNMVPLPPLQLLLQMLLPLKMPLSQSKNVKPKLILMPMLMPMQNLGGTDITDILPDIMDITDITDTFMEPMDTHGTDIMLVSDAETDMVLLFHAPMAVKESEQTVDNYYS